jgi:transcriptional regulator NrdR family protein
MRPTDLINRHGDLVPFDRNRIAEAINRAQQASGDDDPVLADELANVVLDHLERVGESNSPDIERVQDAVLYVLRESGNYDVAMAYARYRDARERSRRERLLGQAEKASEQINLHIMSRDGRSRPWSASLLERNVQRDFEISAKAAQDVRQDVEQHLLRSEANEIDSHVLLSLIETSLIRHGLTQNALDHSALRVNRDFVERLCDNAKNGRHMLYELGHKVLYSHSLLRVLPNEARRLYMNGRLWVDGLSDPLRGSQFTTAIDGQSQVWQVISQAFATATQQLKDWNKVTLILPPIVLGSLEQELDKAKAMSEEQREREHRSNSLVEALENLADIAQVFLYCDGRTPLLDAWPFRHKSISLATYAQDFLILRRLQELELEHLSGPTLMKGGYRRRVGVALALNAQGLDEQFSQLDHIAMGLVAAARARLEQLTRTNLVGADVRYAIYGLPPGSKSSEYLERQITQEGLRCGFALSRTSSLPAAACEHLSRLFDHQGD